jgi:hypothetical protein
MRDACGQSDREGVRAGNPGCDSSASVRPVIGGQAIDPGRALGRVELGGVL